MENSVRIKPSKGFRYFVGYKSSVEFISLGGFNSPVGFKSPVGLLSSCSPPHPLWGFVSQRKLTTSAWRLESSWGTQSCVSVFKSSSFLSFFLSFTNDSFPFLTTDLTHVTFKLRSSSAHHCVLCGAKVEHLILFAGFRSITELSFYSVSTQKR